jgi:hypothetical protein
MLPSRQQDRQIDPLPLPPALSLDGHFEYIAGGALQLSSRWGWRDYLHSLETAHEVT